MAPFGEANGEWRMEGQSEKPFAIRHSPFALSIRALPLVGLGGLEPPTSRLSSARSNQLSYKPELSSALKARPFDD